MGLKTGTLNASLKGMAEYETFKSKMAMDLW